MSLFYMYSKDLKQKAIYLYNILKSFRYVGKLLNIGKSTIHRWVNNIHSIAKNNNIDIVNISTFIKKLITNNKFVTIKHIKHKIKLKFKIVLSLSFVYNLITKTLKYSYKKVNNKFYNKSLRILRQKQRAFLKTITTIDINKIVCIDETYFHSNNSKNYGWSKIGQRIIHYKKTNPIKYSVLMSITNKRIINYKIYSSNVNTNIFYEYMINLNNLFKNHYFLMDNVSFHKSKIIKNIFNNSTNSLLFIPPYSPQFNPIEEAFSQLKRNISYISKCNIKKKIARSIKIIKRTHLNNYFNHSFIHV